MAKSRDGKVQSKNGYSIERKSSKIDPTENIQENLRLINLATSAIIQRCSQKAQKAGLKDYQVPVLMRTIKTCFEVISGTAELAMKVQNNKAILSLSSLTQESLADKSDKEILALLEAATKEMKDANQNTKE